MLAIDWCIWKRISSFGICKRHEVYILCCKVNNFFQRQGVCHSKWPICKKREGGILPRRNLACSSVTFRYSRGSLGHLRSAIFDAICAVPILQVARCTVGVQNTFFFGVCRTCPDGGRKSKIMSWEIDVRGRRDALHIWSFLGFGKRQQSLVALPGLYII